MIPAQAVTITDNDRVRVSRWTFTDVGAATGQHRHDLDYIVVPITGGTFTVTTADGATARMAQVAGEPYLRPAGATHDVASTTATETVFVEIELKTAPPPPQVRGPK